MAKSNWNANNIPNQNGRVVIVTGATSGLGKEAAKVLASKNATVVMAVRNTTKGGSVAAEIRKQYPKARVDVRQLDLTSLASIKGVYEGFEGQYDRLDVLINNAGIMACPYSKTKDGFEVQMGTNHMGHFALTGLLMPLLRKTKKSRIVATSSINLATSISQISIGKIGNTMPTMPMGTANWPIFTSLMSWRES